MFTHLEDAVALLCPEHCRVLPCCSSASLLPSEQAVAASFAALRRCSFDAPSYRSLASLQQGSTLQLLPYYPVVGEEAENKMRYAI